MTLLLVTSSYGEQKTFFIRQLVKNNQTMRKIALTQLLQRVYPLLCRMLEPLRILKNKKDHIVY